MSDAPSVFVHHSEAQPADALAQAAVIHTLPAAGHLAAGRVWHHLVAVL